MSHTEEHTHIEETHEGSHGESESQGNIFVRIVVIIAIIAVLLFVAWAIVKFVPRFISSFGTANVSFSSLFNSKDKVTVSGNPSKVKSDSPFSVNWKNNGEAGGAPVWGFSCVDGITVEYNSTNGLKPVICDTSFPLPKNGSTYSFLVKNAGDKSVVLPMTVSYIDGATKEVTSTGGTSITVLPEGADDSIDTGYEPDYSDTSFNSNSNNNNSNNSTTTNTGSTPNYNNTGNTPNYNNNTNGNYNYPLSGNNNTNTNTNYNSGTADLRVSLIKIGRTTSEGGFAETRSFYDNDRVTVRFNVSNVGTGRSGSWTLRADLPSKTVADRVYTSGNQPALNPGDSYDLTISFDSFDPNGRAVVMSIIANDANQSNNVLSIPVTSNGGSNNNNGNSGNGSRPDLVLRVLDVGVMDNNNRFYYSNSLDENDKVAVKFEVENIGGSYTGGWEFKVDMPTTDDDDQFFSGNQPSLAPGERREYTIGFENPETGSRTIRFEVDSEDDVNESNENNNDTSKTIHVDD